jgi:hypothetical protein
MTTKCKNIGVWIDHQRAVIVFLTRDSDETKVILSEADKQPGRIQGLRSNDPHEALLTMADDVKERRFTSHLRLYYDEVIESIHEAEALFVFGPGEAKGELLKRLAHEKPSGRRLKSEPADKMTYREIAEKVRDHFRRESPAFAAHLQNTERGIHPMA